MPLLHRIAGQRHRNLRSAIRNYKYHKRTFFIVAILLLAIFYLFKSLPEPPTTQNKVAGDRPAPNHDVDARPHFLHRSPFRNNPDYAYESKLDLSLQLIEHLALQGESGGRDDDTLIKKIWQISLQKASHPVDRDLDSIQFEQRNPQWMYQILTKKWATSFVTETFSSVPGLAATYTSYPLDVLRADLLRYLVLWYYGGYYADMDVYPARSISSCPALKPLFHPSTSIDESTPKQRNISLVLGIEIDEPFASPKLMRDWHWSRSYGFIQYTMYAPRRFSPLLRKAIVRVLAHTKQHREASWYSILGPRYDEKTILEVTGPGVFTDAVLDALSETLPSNHRFVRSSLEADVGIGDLARQTDTQPRVTWAPFYHLDNPLWIDATESKSGKDMGGLAVLPINVWGNGQRHSRAEMFHSVHACINHRFGRTWKKGWWEYLFG